VAAAVLLLLFTRHQLLFIRLLPQFTQHRLRFSLLQLAKAGSHVDHLDAAVAASSENLGLVASENLFS